MANYNPVPPPKHTRWQEGQSGNSRGRPRLSSDLSTIKALSGVECARLISKIGRMTENEADALLRDPATPLVDRSITRMFILGAKNGDCQRLGFLLDRAIGKVSPTELIFEEIDAERERLESMSLSELVAFIEEGLKAEGSQPLLPSSEK